MARLSSHRAHLVRFPKVACDIAEDQQRGGLAAPVPLATVEVQCFLGKDVSPGAYSPNSRVTRLRLQSDSAVRT